MRQFFQSSPLRIPSGLLAYYRYSFHSQNEASIEQQRELAHE